jgi:molecular chaperone DnaK (HSP70)
MRLGIDFGTTRTVVAAVDKGRYPVAIFDTPQGLADFLPGLAFANSTGIDFGYEPGTEAEGSRALRSIKRVVGSLAPDDPVPGLETHTAAKALATDYLRFVRRMLVEQSNLEIGANEPLEAMVAVPANSNTGQRFVTVEAFTRAGFQVVGMLNEPTAAAIEFAHRNLGAIGKRTPKRYVVVYDLGGGTFDTSAVSLAERRFELLRSEGIGQLGGDDFDEVIFDYALEVAKIDRNRIGRSNQSRLLELCREAKESLTTASRKLLIDFSRVLTYGSPILVDVDEIYARCQPLIDRTLELLDRVLASLTSFGIDPNNQRELGAIYLVGGATSFPPVSRALRKLYKRKILLAPQPHAATAVGLAIACDPDAGIFVREAVTRHFGVWREGEGGRAKIFDPILLKDTAASDQNEIRIERSYRPAHRVGHLRFLECTDIDVHGQPAGDLTPWGDLYFPYDPDLADRNDLDRLPAARCDGLTSEEIVEIYEYGAGGGVSISIENRTHGYRRRYAVPWGASSGD